MNLSSPPSAESSRKSFAKLLLYFRSHLLPPSTEYILLKYTTETHFRRINTFFRMHRMTGKIGEDLPL